MKICRFQPIPRRISETTQDTASVIGRKLDRKLVCDLSNHMKVFNDPKWL